MKYWDLIHIFLTLLLYSSNAQPERPKDKQGLKSAEILNALANLQEHQIQLYRAVASTNHMVTLSLPEDCSVAKARGSWVSTAFVKPPGLTPRHVQCDQSDSGGGWTVVLARLPLNQYRRVNFNETWQQYKKGFGDITGEHWIGNEVLHALTKEAPHQLRVVLTDSSGNSKTATWNKFTVGSEEDGYRLGISDYQNSSGENEAGDSLSYHNKHAFSTHDRDNDRHEGDHCAQNFGAGWWYAQCYTANPTGLASPNDVMKHHGIMWHSVSATEAVRSITMMIRPATYHLCYS